MSSEENTVVVNGSVYRRDGAYVVGLGCGTLATLAMLGYLVVQLMYNPFTSDGWFTANLIIVCIAGVIVLMPILLILCVIAIMIVIICVGMFAACSISSMVTCLGFFQKDDRRDPEAS